MWNPVFVWTFLTALGGSLGIALLFLPFKKFGSKRLPRPVLKNKNVARWGGVAMVGGFNLALLLAFDFEPGLLLGGFCFATLLVMLFGLADDQWELSWKTQLAFQIALVVLILVLGVRIDYISNPWGGVVYFDTFGWKILSHLLIGFWIILLMNAMNWIDGIDGASGGIGFLGALTIFFLSLKPEVSQPLTATVALALAGAVAGFLLLNFYPARIFAGNGGSMFIGFALGVLSIFAGAKIATTLLVLSLPLIDFFWVLEERFRAGRSLFLADSAHLHHKLLRYGWSETKISLFFMGITTIVAMIALNTRALGKTLTFGLVFLLLSLVVWFLRRKLVSIKNYVK